MIRYLVLILGSVIMIVATLSMAGCGSRSKLSDRDIIRTFTQHRQDFEKLKEMLAADAYITIIGIGRLNRMEAVGGSWSHTTRRDVVGVPTDQVLNEVGIDLARFNEYQSLLASIGSQQVVVSRDNGIPYRIEIEMDISGVLVSGAVRTHVMWIDGDTLGGPVVNGDTMCEVAKDGHPVALRELGHPWYIHREQD